ncbi:MAG TPA: 4Fe-4S dicluster domain-containing protein [Candidatus Paceibacterota bacterium]|nr:4Fe-4S dicluster domain-containing protein [Verrucomicrobiota bacterium]HRZ47231.1 4Fe-4S dicluster domain-containing protein [Candidatus Paceibacterota bacterium]HRZ56055.1 4Fe-4S dicluster domain-containing protein [Candidatus Paceibacterota bacterium]
MAKRKIIEINEALCNGCGDCVTACAEGALRMVDGKARLVKAHFCDGFGDCLGQCPTGALKIFEREAPEYDHAATRDHVAQTGGAAALRLLDEAVARHAQAHAPKPAAPAHAAHGGGGCPGTRMRMRPEADRQAQPAATAVSGGGLPAQVNPSELRQWPIQLHLVQPGAPFFAGKELVIMNTCGPLASADVHWRFLRGRSVVVACPKLDRTEPYVSKLAAILSDLTIPKAIVVRMEVPCCGGLSMIAAQAVQQSGRTDLELVEVTLSLEGQVRQTRRMA